MVGAFTAKHDDGIRDLDLGVGDLAVWHGHQHPLTRAECAFVKRDRFFWVLYRQVRCDGMKALGNVFSFCIHNTQNLTPAQGLFYWGLYPTCNSAEKLPNLLVGREAVEGPR